MEADGRLRPAREAVEELAERAGGLACRLAGGVSSLLSRRDGNVEVYVSVDQDADGALDITAWSTGGCWSPRAWWVHAHYWADADQYGEVRLTPACNPKFAVGSMRSPGQYSVSEDDDDGALTRLIARWYQGWEARRGIRARAGVEQPPLPERAMPLEEFLASLPAGTVI